MFRNAWPAAAQGKAMQAAFLLLSLFRLGILLQQRHLPV